MNFGRVRSQCTIVLKEKEPGTQALLNVVSCLFSLHMPTEIAYHLSRGVCDWYSVFGEGVKVEEQDNHFMSLLNKADMLT